MRPRRVITKLHRRRFQGGQLQNVDDDLIGPHGLALPKNFGQCKGPRQGTAWTESFVLEGLVILPIHTRVIFQVDTLHQSLTKGLFRHKFEIHECMIHHPLFGRKQCVSTGHFLPRDLHRERINHRSRRRFHHTPSLSRRFTDNLIFWAASLDAHRSLKKARMRNPVSVWIFLNLNTRLWDRRQQMSFHEISLQLPCWHPLILQESAHRNLSLPPHVGRNRLSHGNRYRRNSREEEAPCPCVL